MAKRSAAKTAIDSHRHKASRVNIPTEELRDFVAEAEKAPGKLLYPRDPSLDPQLVWKGKDEQDGHDLEVPVVPVYIQEKISPQVIVEDLKRMERRSPERYSSSGGDEANTALARGGPVGLGRHEEINPVGVEVMKVYPAWRGDTRWACH